MREDQIQDTILIILMESNGLNVLKNKRIVNRRKRKSRTEAGFKKVVRKRKEKKELTIKEVAAHTGKIILESAFDLTDWVDRIKVYSEPQRALGSACEKKSNLDLFESDFFRNNKKFRKSILARTWPNELKIKVDYVLELFKANSCKNALEKYFWENIDFDKDGIVSNGDVYLFAVNFNIWKCLYYCLMLADPLISKAIRSLKPICRRPLLPSES